MISNEHIDRILELPRVRNFVVRNRMNSALCKNGEDSSLLIYRLPFVIEFYDVLIENYLSMELSDIDDELMISGNSALGCSIDLGLQDLGELRLRNYENNPKNALFLSWHAEKMGDLDCNLEAIDKLFPLIEERGLKSMLDNGFDVRFDFSTSVKPMYNGLKEKYLNCLGIAASGSRN